MAFLADNGTNHYFFLDRYIGNNERHKEFVYITPDTLATMLAANYFTIPWARAITVGNTIRVYRATDRDDLSTYIEDFYLIVMAVTGAVLTVAEAGTNTFSSMSLTGRLSVTRTGTSWAGTNDQFVFSQGSITGTLTQSTVAAAHVFNINSDQVDALSASGNYNGYFGHTVNSASAKGHKTALAGVISVSAATGNTDNKFYTGGESRAIASANDGGGSGTERGALFGGFDSASLYAGATFWKQVCGREIDIEARAGAAPLWKTGLQIVQRDTDVESGTAADEALVIVNQPNGTAPGWNIGLTFGTPHGAWAIKSTGTMIGTLATAYSPAYAAAYGIDLSAVTFSTAAFKSTGFTVDGSGNLTLTAAKLTLAAGTTARAPQQYVSGPVLTTPITGGKEYEGTGFFETVDTTSGRTQAVGLHKFALTGNGPGIGPTIADFFGANSAFPFVANGIYEFEFHIYYGKNTAGVVTYTLTNTQDYTRLVANYIQSPATGIGTNGATTTAGIIGATAAVSPLPDTPSLSGSVNHYAIIRARAECGVAGNIRLQITSSAGSVTTIRGSYYTVRRVFAGNVGTFVA